MSNSGDVAAEQVRVAEHFFPIWKSGCDGLRCQWASIAAGASESVHLVSDIFQVPDVVAHSVRLVVSSDDEDHVADNDSMTDEHLIQPFPRYSCSGGDPNWNLDIGPGGGCLIATAACGTAVDPRLDILRNFRDRVMALSSVGRAVIEWYYRVSPPIAEYIAPRPTLRAMVRALLLPLLFAISYPLVSLLLAIILVLAALYWYRRRLDGRIITAS